MRLRKKSSRILAASLCLAVALSCTGCKSKEVTQAEKAIKNIGEVTLENHAGLDEAISAYDSLGSEQSDVENAEDLKAAQDEFAKLVQSAVESVENKINAIPDEITLEDQQVIQDAFDSYSGAVAEVRSAVSNVDKLNSARAAFGDLAVKNAIDAIDAIGKVTTKSKDAIDAAQAAIKLVPTDRASDITNKQVLSDAVSAYSEAVQQEKKAAGEAAVAKLKTEKDEVEGITWYKPSCYPKYSNTRCFVLPYIGKQNGQYWLRCKVDYANDNWVFFTSIVINVDGVKRDTIDFNYADVTRDTVIGGKLYESADFAPGGTRLTLLSDIANSQKTIIRFQGSDYYYDFEVPAKDKQGIKDVLAAYDYLT